MQTVAYTRYGPPSVLQTIEINKPHLKKNELLIKVVASTVSSGVIWVRKGAYPNSRLHSFFLRLMFGLFKPRKPILGFEFSGIVEEVGSEVTLFCKGDHVYGTSTGLHSGAYTEYICVPEKRKQGVTALMPKQLNFHEAAALPIGAMTALQLLTKVNSNKEERILIYGASGSVGTYAIQVAKYLGCTVTAACSAGNFHLVRSIGADDVIDYTCLDITSHEKAFDVVFDAVGKIPAAVLKKMLTANGRFISIRSVTNEKMEYLRILQHMIGEGKLTPVIDRIYSLDEIVEAHHYVEKGHKRGNVVITIGKTKTAAGEDVAYYGAKQ